MTLTDWIMAAAVVIQAIYAAATFHRDRPGEMQPEQSKRPARPIIIVALLMLTTWAAVGFDYYDRHTYAQPGTIYFKEYGLLAPSSMYASVFGAPLAKFADDYKMYLFVRTSWANIDELTDTVIAKSTPFTITGQDEVISVIQPKLRISPGQVNMVGFYLVILPNNVSADQVLKLADVKTVGGKILQVAAKSDVFNVPVPTPNSIPAPQPQPSTATGTQP